MMRYEVRVLYESQFGKEYGIYDTKRERFVSDGFNINGYYKTSNKKEAERIMKLFNKLSKKEEKWIK